GERWDVHVVSVSASAVRVRHRVAVAAVERKTIRGVRIVPTAKIDAGSAAINVEVSPRSAVQQHRMTVVTSSARVADAMRVRASAAGWSMRRVDSVRVGHAVAVGGDIVGMVERTAGVTDGVQRRGPKTKDRPATKIRQRKSRRTIAGTEGGTNHSE